MATTADFRNGMCIKKDNDLFQILEFQHKKPGKGAAFVRTKLKSMTTGRVFDHKFSSGEKVETARLERRKHQFLYNDELGYHFMNLDTYEQVTLEEKMVEHPALLKEGQEVEILFHDETETPINCELPQFITLEVTYTEPGIKGDTATNTLKQAEVETGAKIQVPLFIENGEKIKIDTKKAAYVERVK